MGHVSILDELTFYHVKRRHRVDSCLLGIPMTIDAVGKRQVAVDYFARDKAEKNVTLNIVSVQKQDMVITS